LVESPRDQGEGGSGDDADTNCAEEIHGATVYHGTLKDSNPILYEPPPPAGEAVMLS
jgi:hypothetical protein